MTTRLLLSVTVAKRSSGWEAFAVDVSKAFLHADMREDEEVVAVPPKEWEPKTLPEEPRHGRILWKLKKSLYGLKTSPKRWSEFLTRELEDMGFETNLLDASLYTRSTDHVMVCSHVDDMLCTGPRAKVEAFIDALGSRMAIKSALVDKPTRFVGRVLERTPDGYTYSVGGEYVDTFLEELGLTRLKGQTKLGQFTYEDQTPLNAQRHREYRRLVGKLMWDDRPDIRCSCIRLAERLAEPRECDWTNGVKVLRYLRGTSQWVNHIKPMVMDSIPCGEGSVMVYGDSDWGGAEDKSSMSGCALYVKLATRWFFVGAHSRKQGVVALSSAEAELAAGVNAACEGLGLRQLVELALASAGLLVDHNLMILRTDSTAAAAIIQRRGCTRKTRHVELRSYFIQSVMRRQYAALQRASSQEMWADCLTKIMTIDERHREKLGLGQKPGFPQQAEEYKNDNTIKNKKTKQTTRERR
jgi:hypothetical protein